MEMKPSRSIEINNPTRSAGEGVKLEGSLQQQAERKIGRPDCPWHLEGVCRIDQVTCKPKKYNCNRILDKKHIDTKYVFIGPMVE
jgi:hypothetical protein